MKRKIFFSVCFSVISLLINAQRTYYIYLQTENQQPFFVKMNNKIYSSTASGYLIISKLQDTTHNFSLGFPMQEGESGFYTTMNHKDHGYLVKNFGENGWGLFDLQTLGIQMPSKMANTDSSLIIKTQKKEPNEFTELLSKAANDTTLNQKIVVIHAEKERAVSPVIIDEKIDSLIVNNEKAGLITETKEEKKQEAVNYSNAPSDSAAAVKIVPVKDPSMKDTETGIKKNDSVNLESGKIVQSEKQKEITEEKKQDERQSVVYRPSRVYHRSESLTTEGLGMVFIDEYPDGKKDTIRILIPASQASGTKNLPEKNDQLKFIELVADTAGLKDNKDKESPRVVKNDCREVAGQDDFLKLRREMARTFTDEKMIGEARKIFKTKCFTTEQIKNLGALFLADEGKFSFYDAAYYFVSDMENFASLESELKDEEYISRFRSLIKK